MTMRERGLMWGEAKGGPRTEGFGCRGVRRSEKTGGNEGGKYEEQNTSPRQIDDELTGHNV